MLNDKKDYTYAMLCRLSSDLEWIEYNFTELCNQNLNARNWFIGVLNSENWRKSSAFNSIFALFFIVPECKAVLQF